MTNNGEEQLTEEARAQFSEGITQTLLRWDALIMAINNQWGGPNSRNIADQLHSDIFRWFTSRGLHYADELEDLLHTNLLLLNTVADDGSIQEVALDLMDMYEDCLAGNYSAIEALRLNLPAPRPPVREVVNDDDEDDDDEGNSMQIDNSTNVAVDVPRTRSNTNSASMPIERSNGAVEAEDGWVVVSSRRRRN